jgi:hypothetical protein
VVYEPQFAFFMRGVGYGHPKWGHGSAHAKLAVEREDLKLAEADPKLPHHLHIQAISKVTWRNGRGESETGRAILEQLVIGAHAPSGFKEMFDFAP